MPVVSSDRTQHVIDAIDGALDDWSVSDDAMRWTPEPAPRPVDPRGAVAARLVADPDAARRFFEQLGEAMRPLIEWADHAAAELGVHLDQLTKILQKVGALPDQPPTDDPRARALWLRQQRNTGPSRDLTRQRRPRRLP
jgi:hypothetical protein